jgi:hypothetical protein
LLLLAAVLLGGCTRVHAALAVQGEDTVAGDVVLAVAGAPAPTVSVPPDLTDRLSVTPYHDQDYQGWRLKFSDLRFDEVNSLTGVVPQTRGRLRFDLHRAGGLVALNGQVDLSAMPVDRADVQLKVAFPGQVLNTDGSLDSGTVSWLFRPGQVSEFNATVSAPDPSAPSVSRWSLLVGLLVIIAAGAVVLLAKANRNPPVRTGGPGR